jgi:hypothetical protein
MPALFHHGGKSGALLGRIVDHQHAIDAGLACASRAKASMPIGLDRIGVAHQHHRRRRVLLAEFAHQRQHRRRLMPCARARSEARWMVGPSAIGSENGTPSSMMSAPPATSAASAAGGRDAGRRR